MAVEYKFHVGQILRGGGSRWGQMNPKSVLVQVTGTSGLTYLGKILAYPGDQHLGLVIGINTIDYFPVNILNIRVKWPNINLK